MTRRLGILSAATAALVAGGLALGLGLVSTSHVTAIKPTNAAPLRRATAADDSADCRALRR